MITLLRRAGLTAILTVLALPLAAPAYAHVTATPDEADSAFFRTSLRVGHGCEGSPTIAVRVRVPEGVESVRPEVVPGWEVELVTGDGEAAEGDDAAGGDDAAAPPVTEIAWTGGSLPDGYFQEFGLDLPDHRAGARGAVPAHRPRVRAGRARLDRDPGDPGGVDDLDEPAPYVINNVGGATGHEAPAGDAEADAGDELDATAAAGDSDADGSGPMPVIALVAGVLGLVAGLAALWLSLRGRSAAGGS